MNSPAVQILVVSAKGQTERLKYIYIYIIIIYIYIYIIIYYIYTYIYIIYIQTGMH